MSAAKMVADSTQQDDDFPTKSKKRKSLDEKHKSKRLKRTGSKKAKKKKTEEEDNEDLDLTKELKAIGCYVKDRANMIEQMFHCVQGPSLKRALPDVLKDLPMEDLKRRCLEQLEVMSKKRIRRIIAGDDPGTISSSGTEDETTEEEQVPATGELIIKELEIEDVLGGRQSWDKNAIQFCDTLKERAQSALFKRVSHESIINKKDMSSFQDHFKWDLGIKSEQEVVDTPGNEDSRGSQPENEDGTAEIEQDNSSKSSAGEDSQGGNTMEIEEQLTVAVKSKVGAQPQSLAPVLTQNQMEILELEMRARAIRAMLKAQEKRDAENEGAVGMGEADAEVGTENENADTIEEEEANSGDDDVNIGEEANLSAESQVDSTCVKDADNHVVIKVDTAVTKIGVDLTEKQQKNALISGSKSFPLSSSAASDISKNTFPATVDEKQEISSIKECFEDAKLDATVKKPKKIKRQSSVQSEQEEGEITDSDSDDNTSEKLENSDSATIKINLNKGSDSKAHDMNESNNILHQESINEMLKDGEENENKALQSDNENTSVISNLVVEPDTPAVEKSPNKPSVEVSQIIPAVSSEKESCIERLEHSKTVAVKHFTEDASCDEKVEVQSVVKQQRSEDEMSVDNEATVSELQKVDNKELTDKEELDSTKQTGNGNDEKVEKSRVERHKEPAAMLKARQLAPCATRPSKYNDDDSSGESRVSREVSDEDSSLDSISNTKSVDNVNSVKGFFSSLSYELNDEESVCKSVTDQKECEIDQESRQTEELEEKTNSVEEKVTQSEEQSPMPICGENTDFGEGLQITASDDNAKLVTDKGEVSRKVEGMTVTGVEMQESEDKNELSHTDTSKDECEETDIISVEVCTDITDTKQGSIGLKVEVGADGDNSNISAVEIKDSSVHGKEKMDTPSYKVNEITAIDTVEIESVEDKIASVQYHEQKSKSTKNSSAYQDAQKEAIQILDDEPKPEGHSIINSQDLEEKMHVPSTDVKTEVEKEYIAERMDAEKTVTLKVLEEKPISEEQCWSEEEEKSIPSLEKKYESLNEQTVITEKKEAIEEKSIPSLEKKYESLNKQTVITEKKEAIEEKSIPSLEKKYESLNEQTVITKKKEAIEEKSIPSLEKKYESLNEQTVITEKKEAIEEKSIPSLEKKYVSLNEQTVLTEKKEAIEEKSIPSLEKKYESLNKQTVITEKKEAIEEKSIPSLEKKYESLNEQTVITKKKEAIEEKSIPSLEKKYESLNEQTVITEKKEAIEEKSIPSLEKKYVSLNEQTVLTEKKEAIEEKSIPSLEKKYESLNKQTVVTEKNVDDTSFESSGQKSVLYVSGLPEKGNEFTGKTQSKECNTIIVDEDMNLAPKSLEDSSEAAKQCLADAEVTKNKTPNVLTESLKYTAEMERKEVEVVARSSEVELKSAEQCCAEKEEMHENSQPSSIENVQQEQTVTTEFLEESQSKDHCSDKAEETTVDISEEKSETLEKSIATKEAHEIIAAECQKEEEDESALLAKKRRRSKRLSTRLKKN